MVFLASQNPSHRIRNMKTSKISPIVTLSMLAVLLAAVECGRKDDGSAKAPPEDIKTIVSHVSGQAELEREGSKQALTEGTLLKASDVIHTSENSSVDLAMKGFGIVKIGAKSQVEISELIHSKQGERAALSVKRGDVASILSRQNKESTYRIETPTAVAAVRGTSFVVSVHEAVSRISVMDGSIAVSKAGAASSEEIIVEKNSEIVVKKQDRLSKSMVRPLSPESLQELKKMTVFHKNNVLEFNTLVEELKQTSSELTILEGEADIDAEMARRDAKSGGLDKDSVSRARRADVSKTLKRDVRKDPIQLKPNKSYDQK